MNTPNYLFETSWELCNRVSGIHTAIASKAPTVIQSITPNYFVIGPDILKHENGTAFFKEDHTAFAEWKQQAYENGLRIRIGQCDEPNTPTMILVDFSVFMDKQDEIFASFWETYHLDSISGQWDYIEPALFGYAAGKVIENFVKFHASPRSQVVAHFHEWTTGAGVLYLKQALPQVATVFTAHHTITGRVLALNNKPIYDNLSQYNGGEIARTFNQVAKHSLESITANQADYFTTVSEITANECKFLLGKEVNGVTPNGFEPSPLTMEQNQQEKKDRVREMLIKTASLLSGKTINNDCFITATSGRYEVKNKGLDVFIEALAQLNQDPNLNRDIVACLFVPANQFGHRKDLASRLKGETTDHLEGSSYLTHHLHDNQNDAILNKLSESGLQNTPDNKVSVIFVPASLNGHDGIFDMSYADIIQSIDLAVFASYYEPWGYTSLESLAMGIPTITSSLSGFGAWIRKKATKATKGIAIIERNDHNQEETIQNTATAILQFAQMSPEAIANEQKEAAKLSSIAKWESLIQFYHRAYDQALLKANNRPELHIKFREKLHTNQQTLVAPSASQPKWRNISVKSILPEQLSTLHSLAYNLWWTWDDEAQELFRMVDPLIWASSGNNPILLFEKVPHTRWIELSQDQVFIDLYKHVSKRFLDYTKNDKHSQAYKIAYFSMEYGFHDVLKIFSGGLGILAGDYLKEASDDNANMVAVGLLYRFGYFSQKISATGEQIAENEYQQFQKLPITPIHNLDGSPKIISVNLPGREVFARIWQVRLGRINLFLLDTDFDMNRDEDRSITYNLYGGDNENRLKQEIILGIGGIRALDLLGIRPHIFHSNEGHSAFISLERMRKFISNEKLSFSEAKEVVRASTLYTTHTPVPAGHDEFDENLARKYMSHYPERLYLNWDEFMSLGRTHPDRSEEKFNMSRLASHFAQEINGVSLLHGKVTREMFAELWPGNLPEELHIGHVTNGVHFPTWTAREWKETLIQHVDPSFAQYQPDKKAFEKIITTDDKLIWDTRKALKVKLFNYIKERLRSNWTSKYENPKHTIALEHALDDKALTIGFARRFATYKRANLLFKDIDRLAAILNNKEQPIQFLFAGKAHPHDEGGQALIKNIVEISKRPEFVGKILFLDNYDINLAKYLVAGVDIWLNTPTRPLEASGTSGEKAVMNGTLHFSVLDGWWVEGYRKNAGWALPMEKTFDNQNFQDDLDAQSIYNMLENEIAPAYYDRNNKEVPEKWVGFIKNSFAKIAPEFTTTRMLHDYIKGFYNKLSERRDSMEQNNYALAESITSWKYSISQHWNKIEILNVHFDGHNLEELYVDNTLQCQVELKAPGIQAEDLAIELVVSDDFNNKIDTLTFSDATVQNEVYTFTLNEKIPMSGSFRLGIRLFPKHPNLPYRQDFNFIKWL